MIIKQHNPIHPGAFIKQVYIEPYNLGSNAVARKLDVSESTFNRLINAKIDLTPSMALRLEKVIGRSAESWLLMQDHYNLHQAKAKVRVDKLEAIVFA